jgi:hypothetical protein
VQAQQMGALFHLGDGIGYLGCEEHVGRMRRWSATQPDHLKVSCCPPRISSWLQSPIWKLELFNQDPGRLHRFVGEVVERLPFTRDWAAPMRWSWCSQVAARATGWPNGRRAGIAMENLVAFGDNNNDISMFEQVGLAVAMGNAAPQIQAHADRVTADHNEDGIALALQRWVLPA